MWQNLKHSSSLLLLSTVGCSFHSVSWNSAQNKSSLWAKTFTDQTLRNSCVADEPECLLLWSGSYGFFVCFFSHTVSDHLAQWPQQAVWDSCLYTKLLFVCLIVCLLRLSPSNKRPACVICSLWSSSCFHLHLYKCFGLLSVVVASSRC